MEKMIEKYESLCKTYQMIDEESGEEEIHDKRVSPIYTRMSLHYFNTVTISSNVGYIKPRKEIFLRTFESDLLNPEEVMFIGDTYTQDMAGCKD